MCTSCNNFSKIWYTYSQLSNPSLFFKRVKNPNLWSQHNTFVSASILVIRLGSIKNWTYRNMNFNKVIIIVWKALACVHQPILQLIIAEKTQNQEHEVTQCHADVTYCHFIWNLQISNALTSTVLEMGSPLKHSTISPLSIPNLSAGDPFKT